MFYEHPVFERTTPAGVKLESAIVVLTPAESKRLIARAVVQMPEVQTALEKAYVCVVGGTTNGFIAQELAGLDVEPQKYTAGTSTQRVLCVTPADDQSRAGARPRPLRRLRARRRPRAGNASRACLGPHGRDFRSSSRRGAPIGIRQ